MALAYQKTQQDQRREDSDLTINPVMRFLKNQDAFKFNVGDILIKQQRHYSGPHRVETWETERLSIGSPKKYMYVFENELGIGYLKQLRADGGGFTSTLICVVNFDPDNTRFVLDPDFADHIIIGDGDFQYNQEYEAKKKFRQEAIKNNTKILINTTSMKKLCNWLYSVNLGDTVWKSHSWDSLIKNKYKVVRILDSPIHHMPLDIKDILGPKVLKDLTSYRTIEVEVVECESQYRMGTRETWNISNMRWVKITSQKPFPMKDELCGQPK